MASETERRPELRDLEEALLGTPAELEEFLRGVHAADLAEWLEELEIEDTVRVLAGLDAEGRRELLSFASDAVREDLLPRLSVDELVEIVQGMPADEVVDLLALTDEAVSNQVLRRVDFERARGLRELATYGPETAGGLMTTEFVAVSEDSHVSDAIKQIRSEEGPASEEEVGVFVLDGDGRPVGYVSDRDLLTTNIHTPIQDVMDRDLITVAAEEDQEDVAHILLKYSLSAVPVVDAEGRLTGVVSAEDTQEVLEDEAEEDMLRLVGTSPVEQTRLPVLVRVWHRLPLQVLTVIGGLSTAFILDRALPETTQAVDVLRYLPIIIGLAGNVGVQSSTVLVRAFATGELSEERQSSVLASEVLVGILIGLLCGGATVGVAGLIEGGEAGDLLFGAAIGGSILVAVTWAALLGCLIPVLCQRAGVDPAIVAGPFLITLSDVSGAAIFVLVANVILGGFGVG